MKNISITAFINSIFIMAFIGVMSTYILFSKMEKERYQQREQQRYTLIADAFLSGLQFLPNEEDLKKQCEHFQLNLIEDAKQKLQILQYAKLLYFKNTIFGRARIFVQNKEHYIYVQTLGYNLMLKDLKPTPFKEKIALLILVLFSTILTFIYTVLRKKLFPLKELDQEVQKFANGELNLNIKDYGNDEIGKIATSFKQAVNTLKEQIESKNLFMRNMMHELKTPITKGRILAESIEDFEDKELLIRSFERMNEIIRELAQVEKLTSKNITLNPQVVSFDSLVQKAEKILMCKDENIIKEYSNFILTVDSDHFTLVLKNLVDNAIKFSTDKKATIKATPKKIQIISKGEPLKYPLEYYTEPFYQEEKKNTGFGLGLYIVKSIVNIHHGKLIYRHEDGKNIFEVKYDQISR